MLKKNCLSKPVYILTQIISLSSEPSMLVYAKKTTTPQPPAEANDPTGLMRR